MAPWDKNRVPNGVIAREVWEGAVDLEGGSDKRTCMAMYRYNSIAVSTLAEELVLIAHHPGSHEIR